MPYLILFNHDCPTFDNIVSQLPEKWKKFYEHEYTLQELTRIYYNSPGNTIHGISTMKKYFLKHVNPKTGKTKLKLWSLHELFHANLLPRHKAKVFPILMIFSNPIKRAYYNKQGMSHILYATETINNLRDERFLHQHTKIEIPGSWNMTIISDNNVEAIKKWCYEKGLHNISLPDVESFDPDDVMHLHDQVYINRRFHRDFVIDHVLKANGGVIHTRKVLNNPPELSVKFFQHDYVLRHDYDKSHENGDDHYTWNFDEAFGWLRDNFAHDKQDVKNLMLHHLKSKNLNNFELLFILLYLWKIGGYYKSKLYKPCSQEIWNKYSTFMSLHPDELHTWEEL
jgi:hypothetical protein